MANKWLYFPFKDISQDTTMPQNKKRYEEKYGERLKVVFKGGPLDGVGDDDMLIIAGHGLPHSDRVGVTTAPGLQVYGRWVINPTQETITANDLAEELQLAGLPVGHKYVKLITCGGAGMATVDPLSVKKDANQKVTSVNITQVENEAGCLASVLAAALGKRLYDQILVKGYPGFVDGTGVNKTVTVEVGGMAPTLEEGLWKQLHRMAGSEAALHGHASWKGGAAEVGAIPSKLVNDLWYDSAGKLQKQRISLKQL